MEIPNIGFMNAWERRGAAARGQRGRERLGEDLRKDSGRQQGPLLVTGTLGSGAGGCCLAFRTASFLMSPARPPPASPLSHPVPSPRSILLTACSSKHQASFRLDHLPPAASSYSSLRALGKLSTGQKLPILPHPPPPPQV